MGSKSICTQARDTSDLVRMHVCTYMISRKPFLQTLPGNRDFRHIADALNIHLDSAQAWRIRCAMGCFLSFASPFRCAGVGYLYVRASTGILVRTRMAAVAATWPAHGGWQRFRNGKRTREHGTFDERGVAKRAVGLTQAGPSEVRAPAREVAAAVATTGSAALRRLLTPPATVAVDSGVPSEAVEDKDALPLAPVENREPPDDDDDHSERGEAVATVHTPALSSLYRTLLKSVLKPPELSGYTTVKRIRFALDHMGMEFEDKQREFHALMLGAILPRLFGDDWSANRQEILTRLGIENAHPRVALSMPRSGGKTVSVATFIAAVLYAMYNQRMKVVCFSVQQKQSWLMQREVYTYICRITDENGNPSYGRNAAKMSADGITMSMSSGHYTNDPDASVFMPLSGNPLGGRGMQPDLLILEEAAFIRPIIYEQVVVPMFVHNRRAVIAISSPDRSGGIFASLFNMKFKDGTPIFISLKLENICGVCLRNRLMSCKHVIQVAPPWKDSRLMDATKAFYESNPERYRFMLVVTAIVTVRLCTGMDARSWVPWKRIRRPSSPKCSSTACFRSSTPSQNHRPSSSCPSTRRVVAMARTRPGSRWSRLLHTASW